MPLVNWSTLQLVHSEGRWYLNWTYKVLGTQAITLDETGNWWEGNVIQENCKREITNIVLLNSHPMDVPALIFHTTWMGCYIIELQQGTSVPSSRQVWKVTKVSRAIACSALASIDVRRFIKRWFCRGWLSGLLNADLKNDLRVPSWSIVLQNVDSWHPSSPSWWSRSSVSVALLACGPVGQYFKKFYQQIVVWSWKSKQSKGTLQHVSS